MSLPIRHAPEPVSLLLVELPASRARVELLDAPCVARHFSRHPHDEYVLCVVERGALRVRAGRATHVAAAGSLLVLEPGAVHAGEPVAASGCSLRAITVPAALLAGARDGDAPAPTGAPLPVFARPVIADATLVGRVRRLHDALASCAVEADAAARAAEAERELRAMLALLAARFASGARAPDGPARPCLARVVRDHLDAHHARVVTLAELSRLTGRNPFYLSRSFRAAYGVPPYAYLARVRVQRARELLAAGRSPSIVAHEAGFSDQSHFNRHFKRSFGVTPGQYSRAVARAAAARRAGPLSAAR